MPLTLLDLLERLKKVDEISLMELLEISSEDIVSRFGDKIEMKWEYLKSEFDDELDYAEEGQYE